MHHLQEPACPNLHDRELLLLLFYMSKHSLLPTRCGLKKVPLHCRDFALSLVQHTMSIECCATCTLSDLFSFYIFVTLVWGGMLVHTQKVFIFLLWKKNKELNQNWSCSRRRTWSCVCFTDRFCTPPSKCLKIANMFCRLSVCWWVNVLLCLCTGPGSSMG